jgi:hypothetical protein
MKTSKTSLRQPSSQARNAADTDFAAQLARMERFVRQTNASFAAKVASSKQGVVVLGGAMAGASKRVGR